MMATSDSVASFGKRFTSQLSRIIQESESNTSGSQSPKKQIKIEPNHNMKMVKKRFSSNAALKDHLKDPSTMSMDKDIKDMKKFKTTELQSNSVSKSAADDSDTDELEMSGISSSDCISQSSNSSSRMKDTSSGKNRSRSQKNQNRRGSIVRTQTPYSIAEVQQMKQAGSPRSSRPQELGGGSLRSFNPSSFGRMPIFGGQQN